MTVSKDHANVLVVDNNPVLLKALASLLVKEGCTVRTAENGLEALDILRDWHVDIIFTDLVMPLVEGSVLCRIIRSKKEYQHIFVVVLSAIAVEDRETILAEVPCNVCFAKGSILTMRQQVKDVLDWFFSGQTGNMGGVEGNLNDALLLAENDNKSSNITKELLSEKAHLRNVLEGLSEGIAELNDSGKIVRVNDAFTEIFSLRQEDVIGLPFAATFPWAHFREPIEAWLLEDLLGKRMGSFLIEEKDPLPVGDRMVTAKMTVFQGIEGVFGICIFHDITRQFLAEKHKQEVDSAMELMKKMEAMRGMAGGVAHDFNNLLTVICGNLDIVLATANKDRSSSEQTLIENARRASLVAVDLTRTISCFSNFGIVHRVDYDINTLISNCAQTYFHNNTYSHELRLSSHKSNVQVDPSEVEIVISNVLENSIEAQAGYEQLITISSETISWKEPRLLAGQYIPAGSYARVDIKDRGPGIKRQFLAQVFDPYYSTKERSSVKGMGLGLAVVYSVMRNHGGYAIVDSEYGYGTTVSLFFPVYSNNSFASSKVIKNRDKLVIFIESDTQLRELGRIMLEYLGFTVVVVGTGEEALAYILEAKEEAPQPKPTVVLFEMSEVGEKKVTRICVDMQKALPGIEIIGISGTPLDPVMENCRKYGMSNTLTKPYTLDSLKHVLETAGGSN